MLFRIVRFSEFAAVASLLVCGLHWYFVWGDSAVRPVAIKGFGDRLLVPNEVTVFASREQLGRLAGRNSAALADVDFATHDLIRIGWQADGPNFGTLRFAERFGGRKILLYIACPPADCS